jgi:formate hydrogenlyase transcriptional activator
VEYSPGDPNDADEMIGESPALRHVLQQAKKIAPSDATVMILGEPGTGKELLARAIHRMSRRKQASFTKLDCGAIPPHLLQSKLFGYEKGAFGGGVQRAVGGVESAHKATLFLDNVGDLPLELQKKLLRVLQGGEFEKVGSNRTGHADVRLLAAAHQDLAEKVGHGKFRSDLYYRLSVFPIHIPALRERREDIPLLAHYFVQKYARRLNKRVDTIAVEGLTALASSAWPGNVRELEGLMERLVIRSAGPVLDIPFAELQGR